jgi:hypothetical protein
MLIRAFQTCRAVVLALVAFAVLPRGLASAQAADASCQAVEKTESMRAEGHYRDARARLLECVNAQCGGDVRRRCAATLQKLDAVTPSIVVRAEDANGNDVTDVSVKLGDELLVKSLDGMAIPVDPGEHRFAFQRVGEEPVVQTLTIQRGEKFRSIDVQIGPSSTDAEQAGVGATGPSKSTGRWVAGGSLIGVGAFGLVGFTWLGLSARSTEKELQRTCKTECNKARVDAMGTRYVLANVSLGVGVLALGAATWLLLSEPASDGVARPTDEGLAIGADAHGAFAQYSGRF